MDKKVAPLVGAWIEIHTNPSPRKNTVVAPLVGAWIEIFTAGFFMTTRNVAPLVGAWIEIGENLRNLRFYPRRSPRGSVD